MRSFTRICIVLLVLFNVGISQAQAQDTTSIRADAELYAKEFQVDINEATKRLELQHSIGVLEERLSTSERTEFGGLWIQHVPDFKVIILLTSGRRELLLPYIVGTPLEYIVETRKATKAIEAIRADRDNVNKLIANSGIKADISIDITTSTINIYTTDKPAIELVAAQHRVSFPTNSVIINVSQLAQPAANIYGGLGISTCTTGFSVKNSSGTLGISTAGHCSNTQSYSGTNLPYQNGATSGANDIQWHTTPGYTPVNIVQQGSTTRSITSTTARSSQSVGAYICKHGKSSGYTCSSILQKDFCPSYISGCTATYILAGAANYTMALAGDSGGPVYSGSSAYGIVSGTATYSGSSRSDVIYMAINYIDVLGLTVLTS